MKATEYKKLHDRCTQGTATKEEQQLFEAYKDHFNIEDSLSWDNYMGDYHEIRARIFEDLHNRLGRQKRSRYKVWYYSAAVLTILLSFSLWFITHKNPATSTVDQIAEKSTIHPGENKARLITADGREIQLSDANNKILATGTQGQAYQDSSRLIYKSDNIVSTTSSISFNTLITPKGGEYKLQLSDGTKIWLNADSKLKFPLTFNGSERLVELSGEAYFEVAKRKNMPFKVITGKNTIEVLGTHFNVNAYSEEKYQATLVEGAIRLKHGDGAYVKLKPGQQATLNKSLHYDIDKVNTSSAIGWKEGVFMFNNESIREVMNTVSRWYDLKVSYQGDVSNKRFGGTVSRYSSIEELLKTIQLTESIRFKIKGKEVIVMP